jgi:hypothetical protein
VGLVQRRGEFRAKSTRIDLHRLWMHRFDEDLPRIMKVTPSRLVRKGPNLIPIGWVSVFSATAAFCRSCASRYVDRVLNGLACFPVSYLRLCPSRNGRRSW